MLQSFKNFISDYRLFDQEQPLLLALSGGADSVCLFHLLQKGGFNFSVAHCNFKLRGSESDADEQFVKELANHYQIKCHSISFDTAAESLELKKGIQETARKLRYDWFFELMKMHGYEKILTAHHRTDHLETMLINILRSTGIKGLHGIPVNENNIARPLMFTTKSSIDTFLSEQNFSFREDQSNASDYYLRNELRHFVLPPLKNIQSDVEQRFFDTARKVKSYEDIANELINKEWIQLTTPIDGGGLKIDRTKLLQIDHKLSFLFYSLQPHGFSFNQVESILNAEQPGKRIVSDHYTLIVERDAYLLLPFSSGETIEEILVDKQGKSFEIAGQSIVMAVLNYSHNIDIKAINQLYLNADILHFPVKIRVWKEGDKLKPLGMEGFKKVSDILTDKKVANHKRKDFLVVENINNEIVALLPDTIHNDYKIQVETAKVLSIGIKIADS